MPDWKPEILRHLAPLKLAPPREAEIAEELAQHLEDRYQELLASGESESAAMSHAQAEISNDDGLAQRLAPLAKHPYREPIAPGHDRGPFLSGIVQDIRYALRLLRKSPGFTAVAVLTLALGIGANTALFSVVNGVLLNPLPYPTADRLVTVAASKPNFPTGSISYPNFLDWHDMNRCFSAFAVSRPAGYLLTGVGAAEEIQAVALTSDFFPMLGIQPVLGRGFTPQEDQIGVSHVVAITTGLWRRKFASSPNVIGQVIALDGKGYTIVGVFPGGLDLPMGYFRDADIYAPLGQFPAPGLRSRLAGLGIHGLARLKPGVTIGQARSDMQRVTGLLAHAYPAADSGTGATLLPMKDTMVGGVRPLLLLLLGAVGCVLLIACVNVANLLLARGTARGRELAVRSALGASHRRLARQMLTESLLLAAIGGTLGLGLAAAGTHAALAALPATLPRATEVGMDARVLCFSVLLSLGAGILFGLFPAIRLAKTGARDTLQTGGERASGARTRAQALMVAAQMALALVLLAGAGLLIRSLVQLWKVSPGFDPENVLTFNLALPPQMGSAPPAAIRAALRHFDATIAAVPGVQAESLSWGAFPLYSEDDTSFWIGGRPKPASANQMNGLLDYIVGPGYLDAMRIPPLSGRFFTDRDDEHSQPVVVVDEDLAQEYFPDRNPIGNTLVMQQDASHSESFTIVGVVGHVKQWGLDTDAKNSLRAEAYFSFMQLSDSAISLVPSNTAVVVRASGDVSALTGALRDASDRISPDEVLSGFATMHGIIETSLGPRRFAMMLLGAFAALALLLAGIGLYGVMAFSVGQRTREIGIRIALGARPRDVFRLVVGQGLRLAAVGVAIGVGAALALDHLLSSFSRLLYGVGENDPPTLAAVAAILLLVALLACYFPARRAMKVDPIVALHCE